MKHISILVPEGEAVLSSIVGSFKIFRGVNEYLIQTGRQRDNYFQPPYKGTTAQQKYSTAHDRMK